MADILFICPYPELAEIGLKVIGDDDDVDIRITRMDEAVELAAGAEKNGYQVIVSRGLTASKIKQSGIELPVVDIRIGGYDILRAYKEAKNLGNRVGIVDVEDVILGLPSLEKIIEDTLIKYTCQNDLDDISYGIGLLKEKGADVVIGKIAMAREARAQGLDAVIITSAFETVRTALLEARRVNEVRKLEKRKAEQLKAIFNFTYDGIIVLDRHARITVFNRVAEELSGWSAEQAINRDVTEVIPDAGCHLLLQSGRPELGAVFEIGSVKVVGNRIPIIVDRRIEGVVTTFQKLDALQKIESKVRRKLSDKGLTAHYRFSDIIGRSPALLEAVALGREYAAIDSTILLYGRTGTGKEIFAQAIHNASRRRNEPFVAINCAALPESILESELFGYVEGAFTGARRGGKAGVFEMAHGGTLLLDEVGEMPPMLQSRFLRAIEQREVMRLGDNRILPINVRLIAATHRNLREMVADGQFREDLYYRLNVLSLPIPTLNQRREDILPIADHFLQEFYAAQGKPPGLFSQDSQDLLLEYAWPGNIRQLRNAMERLSVLTPGGVINAEDVRKALQLQEFAADAGGEPAFRRLPAETEVDPVIAGVPARETAPPPQRLDHETASYEYRLIQKVLQECRGSKTAAARKLGISRTTLWRKLQHIDATAPSARK
ncbi:MAG: sigma 54-interacting transcriptional regulator [Desulfofustis sp.]|jgi:transcriptional regulator with PAS, ATPase and Fis domain|nr:sigma 54-interacting transcriptional regulator [Desulfofustis sp.]